MKKVIGPICTAALLAAALWGCGSQAESPADPSDALTIYVLRGFDSMEVGTGSAEHLLRQAATRFEDDHPGVSVDVQVGIPAHSAITADDALRSLNAALLGGTGPDIIVLDGLPAEDMTNQGLLRDLTQLRTELHADDYFTNVLDSLGPLDDFALPAAFCTPLAAGHVKLLSQFETPESLANLVATDKTAASHLAAGLSLHDVLTAFYPTLIEDGHLNQDALTSYLRSTRTLLDASTERWQALYPGSDFDYRSYALGDLNQPTTIGFSDCSLFLQAETQLTVGSLSGATDYGYLLLSEENANYLCTHKPLTQAATSVFEPRLLTGVSAFTDQPELAEAFVSHLLSERVQENLIGTGAGWGTPISKRAFEHLNQQADGYGVGFVESEAADGTSEEVISYQRGPLSPEELNDAVALLESPSVAVIYDQVVVEVLHATLVPYCAGECTLEEATARGAASIERYLAH